MMEVIKAGLSSTIQDYGRFSHAHLGVGKAGAIDGVSLHLANRLVGNPGNTAALEMVILTPVKVRFHRDCWIAVTGSNCAININDRAQGWHGWRIHIKKGETVELKPTHNSGMYCYLAVSGGFDTPRIMDSYSTDIKNHLGGHKKDGSTLSDGDLIPIAKEQPVITHAIGVRAFNRTFISTTISVLKGPEYEQFSKDSRRVFWAELWRISNNSNRMGTRLEGAILTRDITTDMRSQGVFEGVIQVPPNGQPLILAAECQSTGGYPRIAVIPQAELWKLAYIATRQRVRFKLIDDAEANRRLQVQQQYLNTVESMLQLSKTAFGGYYE